MSANQQILVAAGLSIATGQQEYTTPGTYSWVCPAGVTKVSVVCIGGGGGVNTMSAAGAGLGYKNNIPVIPGNSYTVVVGRGGRQSYPATDSSFASSCYGRAPTPSGIEDIGGTYVGDGGGNGGAASNRLTAEFGGAGGAGGYAGAGGAGGNYGAAGSAGAGGGGGGGGGCYSSSTSIGSGAGGGTGIYGQGSSGAGGAAGTNNTDSGKRGVAGSGGTDGENGSGGYFTLGGNYGGGGHGNSSTKGGGGGAVRIIWPGDLRQFPSTRTANE